MVCAIMYFILALFGKEYGSEAFLGICAFMEFMLIDWWVLMLMVMKSQS